VAVAESDQNTAGFSDGVIVFARGPIATNVMSLKRPATRPALSKILHSAKAMVRADFAEI
jgi:hypothetical protein